MATLGYIGMTDAELAGVIVGSLALLVAVIGIALLVVVERLKRPRLEIETADWPHRHRWKFAVVHVFNRSDMPRGFGFLTRATAEGCEATLEFRKRGHDELAFAALPARWSSRPEPSTKIVLPYSALPGGTVAASAGSSPTTLGGAAVDVFDAGKAVESRSWDVTSGLRGQEIAIAVRTQSGEAYAWGAESQRFPQWDNPAWKLDQPAEYDVTIRLDASGVTAEETFTLELGSKQSGRIEWAQTGSGAQIDPKRRIWARIPRAVARRVADWDAAWVREK
jgi:hypothetical protein